MTNEELRAIAAQLRRTAQLITAAAACDHPKLCKLNAEHALNITSDWQVPLTVASGPGPKNQPSDPTGSAALRPPDRLATEHPALLKELRLAYRAAADLASHLVTITVPPKIENQRAGVGHCDECKRYCDGTTETTRLNGGRCNACRLRARRLARATA